MLSGKQGQLNRHIGDKLFEIFRHLDLFVLCKMVRYITVFSLLLLLLFCSKKTSTMDGCRDYEWKCGATCM